jgi:hypothetical protein
MKMNVVRGRGPVYWIARDTGKKGMSPISGGWMRELGGYWRQGYGIQFRAGKYVFQFGLCCKAKNIYDEQTGLLYAVSGRMMDTDTNEIGNWK